MSVFLSPVGGAGAQFFNGNGTPLSGGKLYTYAAGTTTPQVTYTSSAGATTHSNPIILDAAGRVPGSSEIWLGDANIYKFVLKDSNDVLQATWDQITGINSNFVNYTTETEVQTATAGQTVFTLTTMVYQPGTGNLTVFVDGVNQYVGTSYVETSGDTVTFTAGLHVGALVKFTTATQATGNATDASVVTYQPPFIGGVATTVEDKLAQIVSVLDFGADPTGVVNATAAFQAAVDSLDPTGGTVYAPKGTYLLNTVVFPTEPITVNLCGDGIGATILQMASPTDPVIQSKGAHDGTPNIRSNGNVISGFSVKAHASGSPSNLNHIAIDAQGFAATRFEKIGFLSNGIGSCGVMFYTSSNTQLTYEQTFDGININGQTGPGYVLKTDATDYLHNTNLICFKNSWVNSNTDMVACVDMSCCTQYTINDNLFETSGDYAIILGNVGHVFSNWCELQTIAPIHFQNTGSVTSASNTLEANYFSGFSGTLAIPTNCTGNIFINNGAGTLTFAPAASVNAPVILGGAGYPAIPTLAQIAGPSGTLTLVAAQQYSNMDGTYLLLYTFAPPAGVPSNFLFEITSASGYTPRKLNASAYDGANIVPYICSVNYPLTTFMVTIPNTNLVTLCVQVTLQ